MRHTRSGPPPNWGLSGVSCGPRAYRIRVSIMTTFANGLFECPRLDGGLVLGKEKTFREICSLSSDDNDLRTSSRMIRESFAKIAGAAFSKNESCRQQASDHLFSFPFNILHGVLRRPRECSRALAHFATLSLPSAAPVWTGCPGLKSVFPKPYRKGRSRSPARDWCDVLGHFPGP